MPGIPACPKGMAWPTHFSCLHLSIHFTGEDGLTCPYWSVWAWSQGPGQVSFPMTYQLLDLQKLCPPPLSESQRNHAYTKSMNTNNPGADTGSEPLLMPL